MLTRLQLAKNGLHISEVTVPYLQPFDEILKGFTFIAMVCSGVPSSFKSEGKEFMIPMTKIYLSTINDHPEVYRLQ